MFQEREKNTFKILYFKLSQFFYVQSPNITAIDILDSSDIRLAN